MIKQFYYSVWTDCIIQVQRSPVTKKHWKLYSLYFMSLIMSFNYGFVWTLIPKGYKLPLLKLDIFHIQFIDFTLSSIIFFMLPWVISNYYFVFRKDRYKKIVIQYKFKEGQLFKKYLIISLFSPIIVLVIGWFIVRW